MPADYLRRGGHGRGNTRDASVEVADVGYWNTNLTNGHDLDMDTKKVLHH